MPLESWDLRHRAWSYWTWVYIIYVTKLREAGDLTLIFSYSHPKFRVVWAEDHRPSPAWEWDGDLLRFGRAHLLCRFWNGQQEEAIALITLLRNSCQAALLDWNIVNTKARIIQDCGTVFTHPAPWESDLAFHMFPCTVYFFIWSMSLLNLPSEAVNSRTAVVLWEVAHSSRDA